MVLGESKAENVKENITLGEIITKLKGIELCENPEKEYEDYMNDEFIGGLLQKFTDSTNSDEVVYSIFQIIAEIAKTDFGRNLCLKKVLFKYLASNLLKHEHQECENISFQACRVLGNICYDAGEARLYALEHKCHISMIKLLNHLCDTIEHPTTNIPPYSNNSDNDNSFDQVVSSSFLHKHLKTAASAFMNLIYDNADLQIAVLESGLMDSMIRMMSPPVCSDVLVDVCFSIIEQYDLSKPPAQLRSFITSKAVHSLFIDLLKTLRDQQTIDSLFQLLGTISEDNDVKLSLCKSGFVDKLIGLMEAKEAADSVDGGGLKISEHINDFIILLLTGDDSMSELFKEGTGSVYTCIRSWLIPEQTLKLQTAGVFAICNFARTDVNCRELIKSGIVGELLALLSLYPPSSPQHLVQHAIFGTLVNLAISPPNREDLHGVVDACLTFCSTSSLTVLFKILACLRMMTQKNEDQVGKVVADDSFMKLLDQSTSHDHKGIMSEALRFFASMTRSTTETTALVRIVEFNGVKNMLKLLDCEHFIMKNEALLAIIHLILQKTIDNSHLESVATEIMEKIRKIVLPESSLPPTESSSALKSSVSPALTPTNQPIELVCNALNLVVLSHKIHCLNVEFSKASLYELTRQHYKEHNDEKVVRIMKSI